MTNTSFLIKNITKLISPNSLMTGGKMNNSLTTSNVPNQLIIFILVLTFLLIKGFIVYIIYNMLMPKLIYSLSKDNRTLEDIENKFRPLSYMESLLLVIFFNTLFVG